MFILISAASIAFQNPPLQREVIPKMPDWRSEFMTNPPNGQLTAMWVCAKGSKISRATISIDDVGVGIRNQRFKVALGELTVEGSDAAPGIRAKIEAALAEINNVSIFQGQCRDRSPGLRLTGFSFDGSRHTKKEFRFDLK